MQRLNKELRFTGHLIKLGLAGLMEYRASFLMQAVGMFINNGVYLVFWMLFFDRFKDVKGYQLEQIFLLFGFVALGFGIAYTFAGNAGRLAEFIAQGRLDYYLTLPRPVLPHVLFSRMGSFSVGDLTFGLMMYFFVGKFDLLSPILYLVCAVLAAVIFVSFSVITGCLAFYFGNASFVHMQLQNTMITFSLYPIGLFQGTIRLILFTLIPAAFVGAVPVEIVQTRSPELLLGMIGVAIFSVLLMTFVFQGGLRRYESGSALHVNL
ncbi:MAG: ABC-2 family transporter protein [Anaerolineae bacterium]|nr:ABC-2 family transporter protein [Anaerolineae bacterium]